MLLSGYASSVQEVSDLADAISWASGAVGSPWKLQYVINEIKHVSVSMKVEFHHVFRRANYMADNLDKEGCDVGLYFSCYGFI